MPAFSDYDLLTVKQRRILDFIRWHIEIHGRSPTVRDIGAEFKIKSPNGTMCHLKALQKKGFITREHLLSRGITLVVPDGHCKACGQKLPDRPGPESNGSAKTGRH